MLVRLDWKSLLPMGVVGLLCMPVGGQAASPEELRFFETKIRPLLAERCFKCHGEDKQKGGLRLDSLAAVLDGGDSGPALVPGKPDESLLIEAVNYASFEMPPDGQLPAPEIAAFTSWVAMGAPWPAEPAGAVRAHGSGQISAEDRAFWSFQPLRDATPPTSGDDTWSRNEIDRFVLQRLTAEGLQPSEEADRFTLVRRVYFDLTGLPPTPEEIAAFVNDGSPTAYEALVDRLLKSPRYGERWARHWLDLVRYAESDGYKQDSYRPNAWRYRDYVIRAFNDDKPYDRFVLEQLAGDEVAPQDLDALAATAYLRHWIYEYNQRDVRTQWTNVLNDITDVTADVFLGLGLGCARCHDHKFDPIPREDYYRLQAFFTPLMPRDDIPFATAAETAEHQKKQAVWEEKTAAIRAELDEIERPFRSNVAKAAIEKFPKDIRPMLKKDVAERTPYEHQLAEFAYRQVYEEYGKLNLEGKLKGEALQRWKSLRDQLAAFDVDKPASLPLAFTVTDVSSQPPATLIPGDRRERDIAPGFLSVFDAGTAAVEPPAQASNSTGRRTALARWITRPDNALTTRVIVNRVWQYHFGRGIVATASDFGHLGERPTHPELLDWLARWFVDNGWSFKKLHRLILTSAVYRQASRIPTATSDGVATADFQLPALTDPDNHFLWRMTVRRLDAEQIRDAALAVSGELEAPPAGGPSSDLTAPRRTIYAKVIRNERDPLLAAFDAPDGFSSISDRNVTTTPTQSLLMINGPWMLSRARALAKRLQSAEFANETDMVDYAFVLTSGRQPTAEQRNAALTFLTEQTRYAEPATDKSTPEMEALIDFCHVLLNSNEFLYVD